MALATYYNLKVVSYESGPSLTNSNGNATVDANIMAATRDPRMEGIVQAYESQWYAAGGGLVNYYSGLYGIIGPNSTFEAIELSQANTPTLSAKYRGLLDLAAASPVAVTAGTALSTSGQTVLPAASDSTGQNVTYLNPGLKGYYLVNAPAAGQYTLTLNTNAAYLGGTIQVSVNDANVGQPVTQTSMTSMSLGTITLNAGLNTIALKDAGTQVLLNTLAVSPAGPPPPPPPPPTSPGPSVGDAGFESVSVGAGRFAYDPSGSAWAFTGGAGLAGNGSAFTGGNPAAPQGTQVAFLQGGGGKLSQSVAGWAAGNYTIAFQAAQRGNYGAQTEDFQVTVDGVVVGTFRPTRSRRTSRSRRPRSRWRRARTRWRSWAWTAAAATTPRSSTRSRWPWPRRRRHVPSVGDAGFESASVGSGNFAYDPAGSAWAFTGGAGVSGNGSAFTAGNPAAPQGAQVAFLQGGRRTLHAVGRRLGGGQLHHRLPGGAARQLRHPVRGLPGHRSTARSSAPSGPPGRRTSRS